MCTYVKPNSPLHVLQANNAYIFPGFGLGIIMSGTIRVHDDMLLAACKYNIKNYLSFFIYFIYKHLINYHI